MRVSTSLRDCIYTRITHLDETRRVSFNFPVLSISSPTSLASIETFSSTHNFDQGPPVDKPSKPITAIRETATSPGNQLPKMRLVGAEKPGKGPRDRWIVPLLTRFTPTSTPEHAHAASFEGHRPSHGNLADGLDLEDSEFDDYSPWPSDGRGSLIQFSRETGYLPYLHRMGSTWNLHLRLFVQQGINRDLLLLILRRRVRKTSYT